MGYRERYTWVYNKTCDKPSRRRGLLSMLSSVYDPLGLGGPFTLKGRQIIHSKISYNGTNKLMKGQHMSGFSGKAIC